MFTPLIVDLLRSRVPHYVTLAAALGGTAMAVGAAVAQGSGRPLHEELAPPPEGERRAAERLRSSIFGSESRPGETPTALSTGSEILPRPETSAESGEREGAPPSGRAGTRRESRFRADRDTRAEGTLGYRAVFNPSVAPFKRMSALDAVSADSTLEVAAPKLRPVSVGGSQKPDRELFWASVQVDFGSEGAVPIPSVAPDMRILSYEVDPAVPIEFFADSADNFYVRAGPGGGTAKLVMLVDADADYFGAPIPDDVDVRDADPDLLAPIADAPRAKANQALSRLGLSADQPIDEALYTLTEYFRSFDAGTMPPGSGNIYWDLFTSQIGVCRHRAFAFAITSNALGIPARYVQNEAHAFAEVHVPSLGWIRVDLGGAAAGLDIAGDSEHSEHRPRHPDPFAKPENYLSSEDALSGGPRSGGSARRRQSQERHAAAPNAAEEDGRSPRESVAEARSETPRSGASELGRASSSPEDAPQPESGELGSSSRSGPQDLAQPEPADRRRQSRPSSPEDAARPEPADGPEPSRRSGPDGAARPEPHPPAEGEASVSNRDAPRGDRLEPEDRRPLAAVITDADPEGFRGDTASVGGRVQRGDETVAGERVDIYLVPVDSPRAEARRIGRAVTGAEGTFEASVAIPTTVALGDYRIRARTPEASDGPRGARPEGRTGP